MNKLIRLMLIVIFSNLISSHCSSNHSNYQSNQGGVNYINFKKRPGQVILIEFVNTVAKFVFTLKSCVKNDYKVTLKGNNNVRIHAENRIRVNSKTKTHIKTMAINKGSSNHKKVKISS